MIRLKTWVLPAIILGAAGVLLCAQEPVPRLIKTIESGAGESIPVIAAWSPNGELLAFGTERRLRPRGVDRDSDIGPTFYSGELFLVNMNRLKKKPKRLLKFRDVFSRARRRFNYYVEALRWSPDGSKLAAELSNDEGQSATFFVTAKGKLARLGGNKRDNFIMGYGGGWLGDSLNYGVLHEAVPPRMLHQVELLRVEGGRMRSFFTKQMFVAVAWLPRKHQVALIERDREFAEAPQLVLGDLRSGKRTELGEISEYQGRLAAAPDENRISYFVGADELAIRALEPDAPFTTVPVPMGPYKWSPAGDAIFYLQPDEIGVPTGRLLKLDLATRETSRVLVETLYDFWLSPDGKRVAVLTAGKNPVLKLYQLP